jgi:pSer/pThr/pTyr-binding forkhead associated (FHA) protein
MSSPRVSLKIDVFDKPAQTAQALKELTPQQLIGAILGEFHELEYLSDSPADYRLVRADTGAPLENNAQLADQTWDNMHLRLEELDSYLPEGTERPSRPIYLRELRTGKSYKIHWQPAIVGRSSEGQPFNRRIAVDLRNYPTGLRASRRHLHIEEEGDSYILDVVSNNPVTLIRDGQEVVTAATHGRIPLRNGDTIRLDRSEIQLKFIVRGGDTPSAAPQAEPAVIADVSS